MRSISYSHAINEAFHQIMEEDSRIFQIGVGVNTPWYVGNTLNGLLEKFGDERMVDTPVSESCITGIANGAALTGLRPVLTFPRMDFMYYAMDQLCNHTAVYNYSLGGNAPIPITIRAIINRGGEQACQHSQALHGLFAHIPGLKIVMPSNARDAKGMLISAIRDDNPVLYIEDRWLYDEKSPVPTNLFEESLEGAHVVQKGKTITIVSSSYMLLECKKAVAQLKKQNISAELIDLRAIKPIDKDTLFQSVKKTGRVVIVDGGWTSSGISAEIASLIACECFNALKSPIQRIALPDVPAPSANILEKSYYPTAKTIRNTCLKLIK